jgi:hypothetical protein
MTVIPIYKRLSDYQLSYACILLLKIEITLNDQILLFISVNHTPMPGGNHRFRHAVIHLNYPL